MRMRSESWHLPVRGDATFTSLSSSTLEVSVLFCVAERIRRIVHVRGPGAADSHGFGGRETGSYLDGGVGYAAGEGVFEIVHAQLVGAARHERQPVARYFPSVFVPAGFGQLFGVHGVDLYAVNHVDFRGVDGAGANLLEAFLGQREVALAGTGGTFGIPQ